MSEVIFDGFDPDPSCLQAAPSNPQTLDPCTVTATYHLRGEATPKTPTLTFRRSQDRFIVANNNDEIHLGLLHNSGFSEDNPLLQSSLFYAVGLSRWMSENYPGFVQDQKYKGPELLPLGKKANNFILAGSIEKPDEVQSAGGAALLKEILTLPKDGRVFFQKSIEILKNDKYGTIRDEMQPRLDWLSLLLQTYETIQAGLPEMKKEEALRTKMDLWLTGLIVYLGTGEGNLETMMKEADSWAGVLYGSKGVPEKVKDVYRTLIPFLSGLNKSDFFKNNTEAKTRLKETEGKLSTLAEEHRAELLSLPVDQAFERSLELSLIRAAELGDLSLLVKQELKDAKLYGSWLSKEGNIREISDAVLPALAWIHDGKSIGWVRLDLEQMQNGLNKVIASHGIQEREFMIGSLAVLRFLFGKNFNAQILTAWVGDRFEKIPIRYSKTDLESLPALGADLEKKIRLSLKQTSVYLPFAETATCLGGIAVGGLAVKEDSRSFTVGGLTTAGVGCGALASHYLYPTRNPYISDSIGGVITGLAVFALSFWLTKDSNSIYGSDGRNPTMGWGP